MKYYNLLQTNLLLIRCTTVCFVIGISSVFGIDMMAINTLPIATISTTVEKGLDTSKPRLPAIPRSKNNGTNAPLNVRDSNRTILGNTVVVTGTRNEVLLKDSPVRVEVIDKEQMRSTAMVTVADVLKEQTGLVISQGTIRTGVQMMGLGPDYTMILVDGQPLTGRVGGVLDLTRISVGNIERIEIVKGPMSSLYGSDALAGVINIITRRPDDGWSGKYLMQYLQYGPTEVQAEVNNSAESFVIASFFNLKKAQPFSMFDSTGQEFPYSGFTDFTLQSRMKWYVLPNVNIQANVRLFRSTSTGKFLDGAAGFLTANEGSVVTNDQSATMSVDWTHGKARLSAQTYATRYDETYNFDVVQGNNSKEDNFGRRTFRQFLQYDVLWNLRNRMTIGGEFLYDDAQGSRYPENPLYRTFATFAQWEGNPTEWISYAISFRYNNNSAFDVPNSYFLEKLGIGNIPLLPRISLSYKPNDNLRIYATLGEGFKAPDFRQLYVVFSNRLPGAGYDLVGARILGNTLLPEQSHSYDFGVFFQPEEILIGEDVPLQLAFDIRFYRNDLRNLIEFYTPVITPTPQRTIYSYRNVSRVFTQGLEATLRYSLIPSVGHTLSGQIGYQLLDARNIQVVESINDKTAGYIRTSTGEFVPLTSSEYGGLWYRSVHTGVFRIQYDNQPLGVTVNLRGQYVGRFGDEQLDNNGIIVNRVMSLGTLLDNSNEYVQGYWNFNSTISKQFSMPSLSAKSILTISTGVNNLFNVQNPRYIPNLVGRQFFVNASVVW